jgi:hypothetical protein
MGCMLMKTEIFPILEFRFDFPVVVLSWTNFRGVRYDIVSEIVTQDGIKIDRSLKS